MLLPMQQKLAFIGVSRIRAVLYTNQGREIRHPTHVDIPLDSGVSDKFRFADRLKLRSPDSDYCWIQDGRGFSLPHAESALPLQPCNNICNKLLRSHNLVGFYGFRDRILSIVAG